MSQAKTIVQCDFDGTITEEDISFILLDAFANGNWRKILQDYKDGKISVGAFNSRAFALVKADKDSQLEFLFNRASFRLRSGFPELFEYCARKNLRFVIVSNGLGFYIEAILNNAGIKNTEIFAAESHFSPEGMNVQYVAPDGSLLDDSFKETYTEHFIEDGYEVIYIGNGVSDIYPAGKARHIFATGDLVACCRDRSLKFTPFNNFDEVIRGLDKVLSFNSCH